MNNCSVFLLILFCSFIGFSVTPVAVAADPSEHLHPLVEQHTQQVKQTLPSKIKQVSFSTSNSIAPYFFADKNEGMQYELLKAALDSHNIAIKEIVHAPNLRAERLVKTQIIDCMINTPDNVEGLFYTQSLIEYQNSVFYLSRNNLNIHKIQDLKSISILGFQNAKRYLGEEFSAFAATSPLYSEITNQKSQVVMLFNGHIQSIVLEKRIFEYYRHLLNSKLNTQLAVTEVDLFAPAERKIACFDKDTAAAVNNAITTLKQSSQYQAIIDLAEQNNYQPFTANNKR